MFRQPHGKMSKMALHNYRYYRKHGFYCVVYMFNSVLYTLVSTNFILAPLRQGNIACINHPRDHSVPRKVDTVSCSRRGKEHNVHQSCVKSDVATGLPALRSKCQTPLQLQYNASYEYLTNHRKLHTQVATNRNTKFDYLQSKKEDLINLFLQ